MKDNIDFFTHDTDAGSHPKHKALIAQFGFEGYGRFWRLNEIIGKSPGCRIDISKRIYFNSLADDLKTSPDELQTFVDFLADSDQCGLLQVVDNCLTTDRTQSDLSYAMKTRKAAARRRKGASHDEPATSPDESDSSLERRPTETTKGRKGREGNEEKGRKEEGAPPDFQSWLLGFLRTERKMRHPEQFAAKVLKSPADYPDLQDAYRQAIARASPPPAPKPRAPTTCDVCGSTNIRETEDAAQCKDCERMWDYAGGRWTADPATGKPPVDDFEPAEASG